MAENNWRIHFIFGTLSSTMAGNDALKLIATRNLEDGTTRMPSCAG